MPSARIMTRAVEDALPLAEDLRTRGFVVQIVSPDQPLADPVDLEVTLEECDPEAALRQADAVPEAEDLHVFVAPGALTDGYRPMRVVSLIPEMSATVEHVPVAEAPVAALKALEGPVVPEASRLEESALEEPVAEVTAKKVEELVTIPEPILATPPQGTVPEATAPQAALPQAALPQEEKTIEIPILSPEVWGARVLESEPALAKAAPRNFYRETSKRLGVWLQRAGADDRMLLKAAMVVAIGAVVTLSVLVLGATAHRFVPLATVEETVNASPAQPVHVAPVAIAPAPRPAAAPVTRHEPVVKRRAHNPEEDIVARDFVIRYDKRPAAPRTEAKKTGSVKHYSDLN